MKIEICGVCNEKEYDVSAHGMKDSKAHSDHYCQECWNDRRYKQRRGKLWQKKTKKV